MGLLSTSMKTELAKANPSAFPVLEIDYPSGTKRYSKQGIASSTQGFYEPRVLAFAPVTRSVSDRRNAIQSVDTSVTISDSDLQFSRLLGRGEKIVNSAVRMYIASANVSQAEWFQFFAGRLAEWSNTGPLEWTLNFRPNDIVLNSNVPKTYIDKYDWPDAHPDAVGQPVPLVYGLHDSSGETNNGAVGTLYVDTSGFRYAVSLGRCLSVPRVYVDETLQSSGYTITYPIVGSRQWTLIDFSADKGTSVIKCDVEGYEDIGDGSGELIDDPSDQIKHFLVNFVYGNYQSGLWLDDSTAPIDTTSFATLKTYFQNRSYVGGRYIQEVTTGSQELNNWCQSFEVKSYWTPTGNLAIGVDDSNTADLYISDPWIRYPMDDIGNSFRVSYAVQDAINSISGRYSFQAAEQRYLFTLECFDPAGRIEASESIELPWGPHFE